MDIIVYTHLYKEHYVMCLEYDQWLQSGMYSQTGYSRIKHVLVSQK